MDWLNRMNRAMEYIEENLEEKIDIARAAQIVCCSPYHFQRMFSFIVGIPLSEYLRRRRLTLAALELQSSEIKIIDLALKYGYESPTAFTRAFENIHGLSPNAARSAGVQLKAFPPMTFNISIKGATEMNYRIEKKEAFRVVGVKLHTRVDNEENFKAIPQFWGEMAQNGMSDIIAELGDKEPVGILGICVGGVTGGETEFDYYIASATDRQAPPNTCEYTVPAATWAIFECIGPMPGAIQELQKRIISEWLPTSGYEYADAPDIELYTAGDTSSASYRSEAWLPIVKKRVQ